MDFLKHPVSDKVNEANILEEEYTFAGLVKNAVIPFLFGDEAENVKAASAQCKIQLGPKYQQDNKNQEEIYNFLHEFCWKNDPEKILLNVIAAYAHVFFKDLKECHDIWGIKGIGHLIDSVSH